MTGLRLQGTPEEIEEAIRRIQKVFCTNDPSELYPMRRHGVTIDNGEYSCYLRVYCYLGTDTLFEQLQAALVDIRELEARLGESGQRIAQLEEELGRLAKPKHYDAVLGSPHRKTQSPSTSNP